MSSSEEVGIGVAARMLGTTKRTLRYYEALGLLSKPALTAAGHRRYDATLRAQARRVLALRSLGVPLASVRRVLDHPGDALALEILREQLTRLETEMHEARTLHGRLSQALANEPTPQHTQAVLDLLEEIAVKVTLSRIYTRTGDTGTTTLAGGTRVDKADARLEVMGDVDELISVLGVAVATDSVGGPLLR